MWCRDTHPALPALIRIALSWVVAAALNTTAVAQTSTAPTFQLRAPPEYAKLIDPVLERLTLPVTMAVPAGQDPAAYLGRLCVGGAPKLTGAARSQGIVTLIDQIPCVRARPQHVVTVAPGDSFSDIIGRYGLSSRAAAKLRITGPNGERRRTRDVHVGDRLTIPAQPTWFPIMLSPAGGGRATFEAALGAALGCKAAAQTCLAGKGVLLLESNLGPNNSVTPPASPQGQIQDGETKRHFDFSYPGGVKAVRVADVMSEFKAQAALTINAPAAAIVDAGGDAQNGGNSTGPSAAVVSGFAIPAEWPFDIPRTIAGLHRLQPRPVVIGVADGGLADGQGNPLSALLAADPIAQAALANRDEDGRDYEGDVYGAGPVRPGEQVPAGFLGTGDIGLCGTPLPDYATWPEQSRELASHGSAVASIAVGRVLRLADATIAADLPRLRFFRMVTACTPPTGLDVKPGDVAVALDYLFRTVSIVNLSYMPRASDPKSDWGMVPSVVLPEGRYLIASAGNDSAALPTTTGCFACMFSAPEAIGKHAYASRLFAIGAATPQLQRDSQSNYGDAVTFYAPGYPVGAVDIAGGSIDPAKSALTNSTSAAAPLVTLAIAILQSAGITDPVSIRERLAESSWPMQARDGSEDMTHWVVDITKVAALGYDVVEVVQPDKDNVLRRHDYVGSFLDSEPVLCTNIGSSMTRSGNHGYRLASKDARGFRTAFLFRRQRDPYGGAYQRKSDQCLAASGSFRFQDVSDGKIIIDFDTVSAVIFNWQ